MHIQGKISDIKNKNNQAHLEPFFVGNDEFFPSTFFSAGEPKIKQSVIN